VKKIQDSRTTDSGERNVKKKEASKKQKAKAEAELGKRRSDIEDRKKRK
jgi:hypothetical protein